MWQRPDIPMADILDEVIAARQLTDPAQRRAAFDDLRRRGLLDHQRVFVGKAADGSALVNLADAKGNSRLRLVVDASGTARVEFLDENGKVVRQI